MTNTLALALTPAPAPPAQNQIVVFERREVSSTVIEFTLRRPDHSRLPDWAPGAHIDLILPNGMSRQYSLCGDRWQAHEYRIAVQREPDGRGGSLWLTEHATPGTTLQFGGPRNNFRLAPAEQYLFIAGGIGITPLLPMIHQAALIEAEWHLLYLGSNRDRLAYIDDLSAYTENITVHCGNELGRIDLDDWTPAQPHIRAYACGPARLLDAVEAWGQPAGGFPAKVERFTADSTKTAAITTSFDVIAARSGVTVTVGTEHSVADALRGANVDVLTSCSQGVCGTCETFVIDGKPDHRDSLLDTAERETGRSFFPCVSRSLTRALTLDI